MQSAVRAACVRFQLRLLQQYTTRATPTVAHISGEEAAVWIQVGLWVQHLHPWTLYWNQIISTDWFLMSGVLLKCDAVFTLKGLLHTHK